MAAPEARRPRWCAALGLHAVGTRSSDGLATRSRSTNTYRGRKKGSVKGTNTTIELGKALSGAAANSRFFWRLAALVGRSAYQCRKEFSSGAVDRFCDRQQPPVQPTGLSAPASFHSGVAERRASVLAREAVIGADKWLFD